MGKVGAGLNKTNDKNKSQINKDTLKALFKFLIFIGKPIYSFFLYIAYLVSFVGLITRKFLSFTILTIPKINLISLNKILQNKPKISEVRTTLKKIKLFYLFKLQGKYFDLKRSLKFFLFDIAIFLSNLLRDKKVVSLRKSTSQHVQIFKKKTSYGSRLSKIIKHIDYVDSQIVKYVSSKQKHLLRLSKTKNLLSYKKHFLQLASRIQQLIIGIKFFYFKTIAKISKKVSLAFVSLKLKKTKNTSKPKNKIKIRAKFTAFLLAFVAILAVPIIGLFLFVHALPSVNELIQRKQEVTTKIYDRNSYLLYKIYKEENRTIIPLEEVPYHAILATLAAEDAEFYSHPGISFKGIIRSIIRNAKQDELVGGSTITQQLIKNTLLTPEKTFIRKAKEVLLSFQVERKFTKDQILEMYLNEVSYGGTAYGIQEASRLYFDKNAKDLTLSESALLASLPKSPTMYSPFGVNPDLALKRQKTVLKLMEVNGFITKEEREKAEQEEIVFAPNNIEIRAPHFVMYARDLLEQKYGREIVETGGLEVITTLDYEVQKMAEQVVKDEISNLQRFNVSNAAVVVMDPKTGEILAMVGSTDYFDTQNDGNVNAAIALRQPGSSIKIVNYAYALSNGFTPATILEDTPVVYSIPGQPPYTPKNYDDTYKGKINLRSALAESRNIPAVKILNSYGVDKMIELGTKMGISTWNDKSRFGLSLTLGGGEVKLVELAQVYATVANYGVKPQLNAIKKVTNYRNDILEENRCIYRDVDDKLKFVDSILSVSAAQADTLPTSNSYFCKGDRVLDERVSFLLTDILKDNEARTPAFGSHSQLVIPGHEEVAVKTGTSNNLRDNLTVGYTQDYVVAVWVGNNDNSPMSRVASGVTGASTIFNKIMTNLVEDKPSIAWTVPEGVVSIATCPYTGTLPCEGCPAKNEWFLEETTPKFACRLDTIEAKADKERAERRG